MNCFPCPTSKWSVGLCSCGNDISTCCLTCFLPCITFGRIAEVLDQGDPSCACSGCGYCLLMMIQFHWIYSCLYRKKLREKYSLPSEPCWDCCVHYFCDTCALCQENAELKARGFDPAKGYPKTRVAPPWIPTSMFR